MKRKIAILLSAMMVTSAMPMTASAAQLKADGVQNTTFAKANEAIDANADKYTTYETSDQLKSRKSVVKVNLNDDGTNNINEEISFKITLENGKFDEVNKDRYAYVNSNGTTKVTYDQAMTGVEAIVEDGGSGLTQVYNNITGNPTEEPTIQIGTEQTVASAYANLNTAIASLKQTDFDDTAGGTGGQGTIKDQVTFEAHPKIKPALDELKTTIIAEQSRKVPDLAHIPYKIEIDSPTTATVTVPNLNLSDKDKSINMGTTKEIKESDITFEYANSAGLDSGKLGSTDFTWTNLNPSGGSKKIEKAKITVGGKSATDVKVENPYVAIPLGAVIADGNGPVKAKVTSAYNDKVVGGEYTITSSIQEGDTSLVYDSNNIKSFEDYSKLAPVVIQENVRNTIGNSKGEAEVTLRLNGGFRFKTTDGDKGTNDTTLKVYDDKTSNDVTITKVDGQTSYFSANDSVIRFKVTGLDTNRTSPMGLRIEGLFVEANNDRTFGDVDLSVSGTGITSQSKIVAKREKLGFKLETLKDPKEIISGRHYHYNNVSMSEQDNTTVEVKFSESVPNTLVESRALDFTVPEGVKIVGMELDKVNNFDSADKPEVNDFEIINNGRTLRLKRDTYKVAPDANNTNILANFTMKLNLSVDPGFSGDIKLGVTGGGQSETTETVIAKAVVPFEIKSQTTKLNMGYQDYNTADITITETRPGMFLENKTAVLSLSAPYGTHELGFSEATFEVTGGELEVKEKDFKVGDYKADSNSTTERGTINFKINKASYKNPSTITIKNVKVGTTRSVPFGAYDLKLGGDAVINNYSSDVKDDKSFNVVASVEDNKNNLAKQNNTSSYDFKGYVNVITETGTFDKTVKVSVGEKTVLIGDQAVDMDVAPYIQASSNSTMVPLRFVSVALGVDSTSVTNPDESSKIAWDANTKTTTIYYGAGTGQKIIQFQAGSNIMTVDGTRIPMEYGVKAEIKDGRMFVPFRALGQALGVTVDWDADTRTAIYNGGNARNADVTTTAASTTTESTTESTTASTTTESTTASDSTTETTTSK